MSHRRTRGSRSCWRALLTASGQRCPSADVFNMPNGEASLSLVTGGQCGECAEPGHRQRRTARSITPIRWGSTM